MAGPTPPSLPVTDTSSLLSTSDTGTPGTPVATAGTVPPATVDGYPAVTPATVDCTSLSFGAPQIRPPGSDPLPFDTRTDGRSWYARGDGIYEGVDPDGSVMVCPGSGEVVREDPYGTPSWLESPELWRVVQGGVPELLTSALPTGLQVIRDVDVHSRGMLAWAMVVLEGVPSHTVNTWHASGTLTTEVLPTALVAIDVHAVAWSHDWRSPWLATTAALYQVDVDPDGLPDWATRTLETTFPVPSIAFGDLTVDACGGVLVHANLGFGDGEVARYDPADGSLTPLMGHVDQGYGWAPLRFGRAPGEEHLLVTLRGGWLSPFQDWLWWHLGVEAPQWS